MDKNEKRTLRLLFTGFSMGLADLVPGVSGGTIALLYGIYDELLYSIRVVTGEVPKLIFTAKFTRAINLIPFSFLIPLALGILTAIFGMVRVVTYLLENHPQPVWALFFGLVLGTVLIISRRVSEWNVRRIALVFLGFIITVVIVGLPTANIGSSLPILFFTGAIASCAMILPGISGSLIMVILGQYENVLHVVEDVQLLPILIFVLGAATGIALFARLLSWLLHNHHNATIAFLIGVLIGSLRKVWPWQIDTPSGATIQMPGNLQELGAAIALCAIGFFIVIQLEKIGIAKEHVDIESSEFKREVRTQHD